MKILLIRLSNIEGNDSANIRSINLIEGLLAIGHEVDFIGMGEADRIVKHKNFRYISLSHSSAYKKLKKTEEKTGKNILVNLVRKSYHKLSVFDNTLLTVRTVNLEELDIKNYYDRLITISDPKTSHLLVNKLTENVKIGKKIQYWGDPLASDITNKTIYPFFILKQIEKKILNGSDKIIYVSPFTRDEQRRLYPALKDKMHFIPPSYNIDNLKLMNEVNRKTAVSYIGAYNSKIRNILPLYEAMKNIEDVPSFIIGDSDLELESTENVKVTKRSNIKGIQRRSSIHICLLNTRGNQIPSKLYYLAGGNEPILIILDGERKKNIKDYLDKYNRFYFCNNVSSEIEDKIRLILKESPNYEPVKDFSPLRVASEIVKEV